MNPVQFSAILALLVGAFGCKEAPPSEPPAARTDAATAEVCPAGQAIVHRGGEAFQVSVADAFANARDEDRIELGAGRAVATASFALGKVRDVRITGSGTTLVARSDIPVVQLIECDGVTLDGVHVVHEIGEWCAHACVEVIDSVDVTIQNCDLDGSGYWGVGMWNVAESRVLNNLFHNCHDGFAISGGGGIELRGNTFKGNRHEDIAAFPGAFVNDARADNTFGSEQDLRDSINIVGGDSPDGRYAVAWGVPGGKVDRNDPRATLDEPIRLETWLVERGTGKIVATLASTQWHPENIFRYFVEVSTCWRADGKAVVVMNHGKWSFGWVAAVYLDDGHAGKARAIDVSDPLRVALENRLLRQHPGEEDGVKELAHSLILKGWVGVDAIKVEISGGRPRAVDDPLAYGEEVIVTLLPDAPFLKIDDAP